MFVSTVLVIPSSNELSSFGLVMEVAIRKLLFVFTQIAYRGDVDMDLRFSVLGISSKENFSTISPLQRDSDRVISLVRGNLLKSIVSTTVFLVIRVSYPAVKVQGWGFGRTIVDGVNSVGLRLIRNFYIFISIIVIGLINGYICLLFRMLKNTLTCFGQITNLLCIIKWSER